MILFSVGSANFYGEYFGSDSVCVNHGSSWSFRQCNRLIYPTHHGSGCYRVWKYSSSLILKYHSQLSKIHYKFHKIITAIKGMVFSLCIGLWFIFQFECSNTAGLVLYVNGMSYQCLQAGQTIRVRYASKHYLHDGSIVCPYCPDVCQVRAPLYNV